jgi:hypothetical protein
VHKLLLFCEANLNYALSQEGLGWKCEFPTMHQALEHARSIIKEDTPLSVYSSRGKVILETVLPAKAGPWRRAPEEALIET